MKNLNTNNNDAANITGIHIGETYNYFDDGKIKLSRRIPVTITDIIPFDEIDSDTLEFWKQEIEEVNWVYAKDTDYFIKADLEIDKNIIKKIIFVRSVDHCIGKWFSIGFWGGVLDIDGSLNNMIK